VPTYSYACTACDHRFDTVQAFTDPSLTECPECSGRLRKLFSSVGIVFKGSGFYRNDSRAKPDGSGGEGKSDGKAGKSEDGSDKPAAKSTEKSGSGSSSGSDSSSSGSSSSGSSKSGSATKSGSSGSSSSSSGSSNAASS
jgi:putative FmdB family regulatory protein